jgi:hypothetical protein
VYLDGEVRIEVGLNYQSKIYTAAPSVSHDRPNKRGKGGMGDRVVLIYFVEVEDAFGTPTYEPAQVQ